jgi:hypothetical protein
MQNTQYSRPMNINNDQLGDIVVEIARQRFGSGIFRRRPLMTAVETHLLQIGAWTPEDDALSSSVGIKSEGLAKIDWAISHLKQKHRLLHLGRDRWQVP